MQEFARESAANELIKRSLYAASKCKQKESAPRCLAVASKLSSSLASRERSSANPSNKKANSKILVVLASAHLLIVLQPKRSSIAISPRLVHD